MSRNVVPQFFTGSTSFPDPIPVSTANPLPVALYASSASATPTDAGTLSITSGGVSQTVFAANASRRWFFFQNISDTAMWLNFGAAATADSPSIYLPAGYSYETGNFVPATSITVICATTGKKFTAKEA